MKVLFNIRIFIKIVLISAFCSANGYAQFYSPSSVDYTFSTSTTGSLALDANNNSIDMGTGTQQLIGSYQDDETSVVTDIGFTYVFMGKPYQKFSVSSNGILALGDNPLTYKYEDLNHGTEAQPFLSAFAADMTTGSLGKIHYKIIGNAPNRCLVVEYLNMCIYYNTTSYSNDATFQIRLYENTGMVEYVYGTMYVSTITNHHDDIGIGFFIQSATNNNLNIGNCTSIDFRTQTNSTSITYIPNSYINTTGPITNLNSSVNGNRRTYRLTPKNYTLNLPTNFFVSDAGVDYVSLQWDLPSPSTGITGFALYRSTDNVNFDHIENLHSFEYMGAAATSLNPLTNYYWRIYTLSTGSRSSNYVSLTSATLGGTFMGYKTIGNVGADYNSITAALNDAELQGIGGQTILSLQDDYSSTNETFPITFNYISGLNANSTIVIKPTVPGLIISSDNPTATIDFNGANHFVIDGRLDWDTDTPSLIIENTSTSGGGSAIRFINDATYDTVKFCHIKSVFSANNTGVINFSTASGYHNNSGNDHITIHSNQIDCGAGSNSSPGTNTAAYHGIYAEGSSNVNLLNSEVTIANNNIYNFYSPSSLSTGINITSGNSAWIIKGNSIYQTSSRIITGNSARIVGINIANQQGNNFDIDNNYIGGSEANALGSAWTTTSNFNTTFKGISVEAQEGGTISNVNGNYIRNINFSSNTNIGAGGVFSGIYFSRGNANIGTALGNTIGSSTGTGSISVTNSSTAGYSSGIYLESYYSYFNISNNNIGSITILGSSNNVSHKFLGISFNTGDSITIYRNTIGSLNTANSINLATPSTSNSVQSFIGIKCSRLLNIKENIVANINNAYLSGAANSLNTVTGIYADGYNHSSIISNTIKNLSSDANANGIGNNASIVGINSLGENENINGNTIHALVSTNINTDISIIGLLNSSTASNALISKNFIHSISNASLSNGNIYGLYSDNTKTSIQNNMIRLGIDDQGNSITSAQNIRGIYEEDGTNSYFHNTVFIGGTAVTSEATNTYAFYSGATNSTRAIQNNIFVNNRSNSNGTGLNVAYYVAGKLPSITGLTSNNNIYFANGIGGILIRNNNANYSLSAWRKASGLDFLSHQTNPNLVNATGNSNAVDLHVQGKTSAEKNGTYIASVFDDYDGSIRSNLTPTDIGADAGTYVNQDGSPPNINFQPLTNGTAANRTLNNFATITDNIGISNTNKPRLYFKTSTDSNTFGGNTSSDNGWKYVIASNSTSPYSFTINYSILFGGSVTDGTIIEYFIVAQDDSNNISSYPEGAGASTNPPVANVNSKPSFVFSYTIYTSTIGGSINVGVGQTYTSLTGVGGLFQAINTKIVTDDITIKVTSNLTEDGTVALNHLSEDPYQNGFSVTIKSNNSFIKTISGTNVADGVPMININGADNVFIDGRFGFSGPCLTFRNTNTDSTKTGPVILFNNSSTGCNAFFVTIESNASNSNIGSITIGDVGTNSVEIQSCRIREANGGTFGKPRNCIYSNSEFNWLNIISNKIYNFYNYGLLLKKVADSCSILNNSFYCNTIQTTPITCISVQSGNEHNISNNYIGGEIEDADGVWVCSENVSFTCISSSGSMNIANSIQNNTIRGIQLNGNAKNTFTGIEVLSGKANIGTENGNYIGNSVLPITVYGDSSTTGIMISSNDEINISNNTINYIYANGEGSNVSLKGIHYCGKASPFISSNIITNLVSSGSSTDHDSTVSVCGLLSNNISLNTSIIGNQIYNLSAIHPTASTLCMGIAYSTANDTGHYLSNATISKNAIHSLSNLSNNTSAGIYGIYLFNSNPSINYHQSLSTLSNNMISLSNGTDTNGINIKGIYAKSINVENSIFYNSIYIGGTSNTPSNTYCFERNDISKNYIKNNIFINKRSSTVGKNYSFGNTTTNPNTNWISSAVDYNLYYTSNPATTAYWSGDKTFSDFKTASSSSANSKNVDVNLFDPDFGDLHIDGNSIGSPDLQGTVIASITEDFDGEARPNVIGLPYIGADEVISNPLPLSLLTFTGYAKEAVNVLSWTTASEINSSYFEIQRLNSQKEFSAIGKVNATSMNKEINSYQFDDNNYNRFESIAYYRLKMVDKNNSSKYSEVIAVKRNTKSIIDLSIYPNPSSDILNVLISTVGENEFQLKLFDMLGKVVYETHSISNKQILNININELPPGLYSIQVIGMDENITKKFIKK